LFLAAGKPVPSEVEGMPVEDKAETASPHPQSKNDYEFKNFLKKFSAGTLLCYRV